MDATTAPPSQPKTPSTDAELIHDQMVEHLRKYNRSEEPPGTQDAHVVAALASRLPAFDMSPAESALYPHYLLPLLRYCFHRNRMLAMWFDNPCERLSLDKMLDGVVDEEHAMVRDTFAFLERYQLINSGILSLPKTSGCTGPRVIIVGAGAAGLAAARSLTMAGCNVIVLEARNRIGGRVYSPSLKSDSSDGHKTVHLDLGASIITGFGGGNPLAILALQMKLHLHQMTPDCPLYDKTGQPLDPDTDRKVEDVFNQLLDAAGNTRNELANDCSIEKRLLDLRALEPPLSSQELTVFEWHMANLEFANAALLSQVSLKYWDQDDGNEFSGAHSMIYGGYGQVTQSLAEGLDVRLNSAVAKIAHDSDSSSAPATVTLTNGTEYHADAVIVTVPLGVLKHRSITFDPPLPQAKQEAIDRLGFGALNKVALLFDRPPWRAGDEPPGLFGSISPGERGMYFLFINASTITGQPALLALVSGMAAYSIEAQTDTQIIDGAMATLRRIFGNDIPDPVDSCCTRWASDEFCFGSYSSIPSGSTGEDYDVLSASMNNRLFFAGEATNRRHPATVHGAILSGYREAAHVLNAFKPLELSPIPTSVGAFNLPLHCAWEGCTAVLGPKQTLKDHFIVHHLSGQERETYYKRLSRTRRYFSRKLKPTSSRYKLRSYLVVRKSEFVIDALPGADKLSETERSLLQKLRLTPEFFQQATEKAVELFQKYGPITKTEMRKHFKIDVNKSSRLYDYWVQKGLIQPSYNSTPTNMLAYS